LDQATASAAQSCDKALYATIQNDAARFAGVSGSASQKELDELLFIPSPEKRLIEIVRLLLRARSISHRVQSALIMRRAGHSNRQLLLAKRIELRNTNENTTSRGGRRS
jgi:hypothetical protein